ncbi:hypothetical protein AVEN_138130-1 [Araneus ventricosus]|uniref:Uncharacterized protein n=1 Tax=Araneus ventricosus TaxID=182803 RepID=A0A4Y2F7X3_ARAVE|nr:hypothetical protein AVEN_138130-1 [Araneus ventricosus]
MPCCPKALIVSPEKKSTVYFSSLLGISNKTARNHLEMESVQPVARMADRSKTPDASFGSRTRACVRTSLLTKNAYVNCDKDIVTAKLFTINGLIEDKLPGANLSDDAEVIPPFFIEAMGAIEKLRTYFFGQKESEKTFSAHNSIHNIVDSRLAGIGLSGTTPKNLQRKILEDLRKLDCSENVGEEAVENGLTKIRHFNVAKL